MPVPKTDAPSETETVNETTGKTEVNTNDFLSEDEGNASETTEESKDTTEDTEHASEETTETTEDTETTTETEEESEETETSEETEEESTPSEKAPKLFAGKYKNIDDLKEAFRELGGEPDEYKDEKLLAEAYLVRQREYTRVHQTKPTTEEDHDHTPTEDEIIDQTLEKIDFSKVKNAKDAIREATRSALQIMRQMNPGIDEKQLTERLATQLRDRDQKQSEISAVEADVPRLKTDQGFRKQFAYFVMDQQKEGSFVTLKSAMRDFLNTFSTVVDEAAKAKQKQKDAKRATQQPAEHSQDTGDAGEKGDEVDDILKAHSSKPSFGK